MHRLLALGFAACFILPAHAEHWDWDIGYKRPGFVHHHLIALPLATSTASACVSTGRPS